MRDHAEIIAHLVADLSIERIKRHVEILSEHIGPRPAGSTAEYNTAVYVFNELESYGLKPEFVEFDGYVDRPVTCRLQVLHPRTRHVIAESLAWSASTDPAGFVADLIDGGDGSDTTLDGLGSDVAGKIVVARAGKVWRGTALRNAQDRGARALILVSTYEGAPISNLGTTGTHAGNPLPASDLATIPGIGVSHDDGVLLAALLASGRVSVRVEVLRDTGYVRSQNVVATLPGARYPDQVVSMGAHMDQWSCGAYDSGSQLADMLEIARLFAKATDRPDRSIQFCGWGAHEHSLIGSTHHAFYSHADDVVNRMVGHVNCCPIVGGRGQTRASLTTCTGPEIRHLMETLVDRYGWREGWRDTHPFWDGSDHFAFVLRGVPTCQPRGWYLGAGNPYYHSVSGDTYRNVWFDEDNIRDAFRMHAGMALFLANGPIVPLRYRPVASALRAEVETLQKQAGAFVNFAPLVTSLKAMEEAAQAISDSLDPLIEPARPLHLLSDVDWSALEQLSDEYMAHGKRLAAELYELDHFRIGSQPLEGESGEGTGLIPAFIDVAKLSVLSPSAKEHRLVASRVESRAASLATVVQGIADELSAEKDTLQGRLSAS